MIKLREADNGDIPAIMSLFRDTIREVNSRVYTPEQIAVWSDTTGMESAWKRHIKEQHFIVAESAGEEGITGFSSIAENGYLDFMYVHKDHQREGVASALLAEVESKAIDQKNREIFSHVSRTAKGFFLKNGYIHVRDLTDKAKGMNVVFINALMVKVLR
ncbi:MAG: GNAT family N-acetyltransferase [Ignavibacteria bacterium]|nr:GNAT family N-acetyltransferase [Ignavibacteria bacterium]